MAFAVVAPDVMQATATEVADIASRLSTASAAAATHTTAVAAAAGDEVSAAIALFFSNHGQAFQALHAQAASFHGQFAQALAAGAETYASAEVGNASLLQNLGQQLQEWVNAPAQALLGHPLFGNGGNSNVETTATAAGGGPGGAGSGAGTTVTPALDANPTTAATTGGIAFVMGPTGFPQPSAAFVATVERLYLQPLGFHGQAVSLYTPELGYNTDTNLPLDVADLMTAIHGQMATGQVSAENPIWVFGYSQSSAAASAAMIQLHAEGVPSSNLHFVLVGDPASAHGGILNTLIPSLGPLGPLIKPLLPLFDLDQTMGLTTPNYYPADVYTLAGDGYAAWPQNFFADPIASLRAILGFFTSHELYLGLSSAQIQSATLTHTDGMVQYHTVDDDIFQLLPALIRAAVNMEWISPAVGEFFNLSF